jgi:hypothetical protein
LFGGIVASSKGYLPIHYSILITIALIKTLFKAINCMSLLPTKVGKNATY